MIPELGGLRFLPTFAVAAIRILLRHRVVRSGTSLVREADRREAVFDKPRPRLYALLLGALAKKSTPEWSREVGVAGACGLATEPPTVTGCRQGRRRLGVEMKRLLIVTIVGMCSWR